MQKTEQLKEKTKSQLHAGHRSRLRARARKDGIQNLTEHQVLEYLLSFVIARKDTNDLAHKLIDAFGSLDNIIHARYSVLEKFNGLGEVTATFLTMIPQLIHYLNKHKVENLGKISHAKDVLEISRPFFHTDRTEKMVIILMDINQAIIKVETIKSKAEDHVSCNTYEINDLVQRYRAKKVILVHNHPNGDATPSVKDIHDTHTIYHGLKFLGIELLDHFIVTDDDYYSLSKNLQLF